jgi:hypothetical protein
MSEYNMGKLGVVAPFKAKEGSIAMKNGVTAHGTIKVPTLSAELEKGAWVELDGAMTVKALTTSGVPIGIVYNYGKWVNGEPTTDMNQSAAVSAEALREVGIETIFKKILTVDVTGTVNAGNYLVPDNETAGKFEQSASSGTTKSDIIALTAKDSNNQAVVGFI